MIELLSNNIKRHVGQIIPTFVFISWIFSSTFLTASADEIQYVPDFAFPQTVEVKSDSILSQAIAGHNDEEIIRMAMNIIIARNQLSDSESVEGALNLLDSVSGFLDYKFIPVVKVLKADILFNDYSLQRHIYDLRSLPLESPWPADPSEWSGKMFKERILELVTEACGNLKALNGEPLSSISRLLSDSEKAEKLGFDISSFIAFKSINLLRNFTTGIQVETIPFFPDTLDDSLEKRCQREAESLIREIIQDLSPDKSVVKALAIVENLYFVSDSEKEKYLRNETVKFAGSEGEGLLLYELWKRYDSESPEIYKKINSWIDKFPEAYGADNLRLALNEISRQNVTVNFPSLVLPEDTVKGTVTVKNLSKSYLLVYKLEPGQFTEYDELILKKFNGKGKPCRIIEVGEQGEVPYTYEKAINIEPLQPGLYVVIPSLYKTLGTGWNKPGSGANYGTFRVTDIAILSSNITNIKDSGKIYVVKGKDQQPVKGATVEYFTGGNKKPVGKGVTNDEGWVPVNQGYYRVNARFGNNVARSEAGFGYFRETDKSTPHASILTDLSVYRPGDTVKFAVVGWKQDKLSNSLIKDTDIVVTLRDANYQVAGTDTLRLNVQGRVSGEMTIPQGRLLGNYQLTVKFPESKGQEAGVTSILVEEYKIPSFRVTLLQEETDTAQYIKYKGKAQTYSGMAVTDAKVNVKIEYLPWRWGLPAANASYRETTVTNSSGEFSVELPLDNLKGTPFETGRYSISAEVTAPSGETVISTPGYFYLGKANEIRPAIKDKVCIKGDSLQLYIPVFDISGMPEIKEMKYKFTEVGNINNVIEGEFLSPNLILDSETLLSGKYELEFWIDDEPVTKTETVFWRENDNKVPYPTPLWVPERKYVYSDGQESVDVRFGSSWKDWILMVVSTDDEEITREWVSPSEGLITKTIAIPQGNPTIFVTVSGMHDFTSAMAVINIVPEKSLEKMEIVTETFRDKLSAGDKENWTFRIKTGKTGIPFANVFAVMTDKAIDYIKDFNWNLNIWKPSFYSKVRINTQNSGSRLSYRNFTSLKTLNYKNTGTGYLPDWNTYGFPLVSIYNLRFNTPILYRSMASKQAVNSAGLIVTDAVEDMSTEMETSDEAGETMTDSKNEDVDIRPVEIPVAFFKPYLEADENGTVTIDFTVPDFNTTWKFQLAAYNDELLNSVISLEAVASKPLMVKTNLPQFLRTGDKAFVYASVFNNSEENISAEAMIEVKDGVRGDVIGRKIFKDLNISAAGNEVIGLSFEVPVNTDELIITSIAKTETHSDGERGSVMVMPSSTPVIDSKTFYISSDKNVFEIKAPKIKKGGNITLKYCDNPMWEVILSLPSSKNPENSGSLSVANWLYGSLITSDIFSKNDIITQKLTQILAVSDSTLLQSNLEKDASLKTVSLEMTPWVNNALNETERMRGLGWYLDKASVKASIEDKINVLGSLQLKDGGWSWFEGMKSSPYITSEIISVLGYLNRSVQLPDKLETMARKAVNYYDSYLVQQKKKSEDLNVKTVLNYLYYRNMLGYGESKEFASLHNAMVDSISGQWRYWDIGMKAKAGTILLETEGKRAEAELIAASLSQYIGKKTSLSENALMLDFLSNIGGRDAEVEKLTEKMMLLKETREWGAMKSAPMVINTLLETVKNEEIDREDPLITVNGKNIELSALQSLTGNFTVNFQPEQISGKTIRIERQSGLPAWGGIVCQYIAPIKDVRNERVENMKIEKHVFVQDSEGNVKETVKYRKGDKILVVLNLNVTKDMDYVAITDSRSACLQTDERISGIKIIDGLPMYCEYRADKTSFFIENLSAGKHVISYGCHADRDGEYSLGIATAQSLYAPTQEAHTEGKIIDVTSD